MSQGFFDREQRLELKEWKRIRSLGWIIQCGYADPQKMPANQIEWWPMAGDVLPKSIKMTKARMNRVADRIKMELGRVI